MFVFAFVHSQKKEPVGNDDYIPENAQNLDELTIDILAVSDVAQGFLPGLSIEIYSLMFIFFSFISLACL